MPEHQTAKAQGILRSHSIEADKMDTRNAPIYWGIFHNVCQCLILIEISTPAVHQVDKKPMGMALVKRRMIITARHAPALMRNTFQNILNLR